MKLRMLKIGRMTFIKMTMICFEKGKVEFFIVINTLNYKTFSLSTVFTDDIIVTIY